MEKEKKLRIRWVYLAAGIEFHPDHVLFLFGLLTFVVAALVLNLSIKRP